MFNSYNIRFLRAKNYGVRPVYLLSNENGKFQLNAYGTLHENSTRVKGAKLLNGNHYHYIYNPVLEADTFNGLISLLNEKYAEYIQRKETQLLPVNLDDYDAIIDKQKNSKITLNSVNKYLKAVGINVEVTNIRKRRNRNFYEVSVTSSDGLYTRGSISVNGIDVDRPISSFVELLLVGIIVRQGEILYLFPDPNNYFFMEENVEFFDHLFSCLFRFSNLKISMIRYREMFQYMSAESRIVVNNFLRYVPIINQNIKTNEFQKFIEDFGLIFYSNHYAFSIIGYNTVADAFNGIFPSIGNRSIHHATKINVFGDEVEIVNLFQHFEKETQNLINANTTNALNWFSSFVGSIPDAA